MQNTSTIGSKFLKKIYFDRLTSMSTGIYGKYKNEIRYRFNSNEKLKRAYLDYFEKEVNAKTKEFTNQMNALSEFTLTNYFKFINEYAGWYALQLYKRTPAAVLGGDTPYSKKSKKKSLKKYKTMGELRYGLQFAKSDQSNIYKFKKKFKNIEPPEVMGLPIYWTDGNRWDMERVHKENSRLSGKSFKINTNLDVIKFPLTGGRTWNIRKAPHVDENTFNAVADNLDSRAGIAKSGWVPAIDRLWQGKSQVKNYVRKHGHSNGSINIIETGNKIRIKMINNVKFISKFKTEYNFIIGAAVNRFNVAQKYITIGMKKYIKNFYNNRIVLIEKIKGLGEDIVGDKYL